jgi:hypothetical protein
VAQVVEYLPSKPEAPSSNPSTTKKKKLFFFSGCQQLIPVILATQETEIKRIEV